MLQFQTVFKTTVRRLKIEILFWGYIHAFREDHGLCSQDPHPPTLPYPRFKILDRTLSSFHAFSSYHAHNDSNYMYAALQHPLWSGLYKLLHTSMVSSDGYYNASLETGALQQLMWLQVLWNFKYTTREYIYCSCSSHDKNLCKGTMPFCCVYLLSPCQIQMLLNLTSVELPIAGSHELLLSNHVNSCNFKSGD